MSAHSPSFRTVQGARDSPVILHVPHSATTIPADARESIVLNDEQLRQELAFMTDAHTEYLAVEAARGQERTPWLFLNILSRLVIDPERLPDDQEVMAAVGMGAVYTSTSHRAVLRVPDLARDTMLRTSYFEPYAVALADLVDDRLAATGSAVIIDVHSYPTEALPYELHADDARPPVCLGVDPDHTPDELVRKATEALAAVGDVRLNEPFAGTYVPLRHFQQDRRVESLMVELRRDTYMVEPGGAIHRGAEPVVAALAHLISQVG